jgi:hypothetical protein
MELYGKTGYRLDGLGFESRQRLGVFSSPPYPDRLWSPSNGYQGLFPWR